MDATKCNERIAKDIGLSPVISGVIKNTKYDELLLNLEFYKTHTSYLPFIGDNYDKSKILIIGESHYIGQTKDNEKYNLNYFENHWWNGTCQQLDNEYLNWYNTRKVISNYLNGDRRKGHLIFTNIVKSYSKIILNEEVENIDLTESQKFNDLAFMNFFQMPSIYCGEKYWNSLKLSGNKSGNIKLAYDTWDKAVELSSKVLDYVIDILSPKLIVFTSVSAYNAYIISKSKYTDDKRIVNTPHPSSVWWNKASTMNNGKTGKEIFEECLLGYKHLSSLEDKF